LTEDDIEGIDITRGSDYSNNIIKEKVENEYEGFLDSVALSIMVLKVDFCCPNLTFIFIGINLECEW